MYTSLGTHTVRDELETFYKLSALYALHVRDFYMKLIICLPSTDIWLFLQLPTSPPPPHRLGVRRVAFYLPIH